MEGSLIKKFYENPRPRLKKSNTVSNFHNPTCTVKLFVASTPRRPKKNANILKNASTQKVDPVKIPESEALDTASIPSQMKQKLLTRRATLGISIETEKQTKPVRDTPTTIPKLNLDFRSKVSPASLLTGSKSCINKNRQDVDLEEKERQDKETIGGMTASPIIDDSNYFDDSGDEEDEGYGCSNEDQYRSICSQGGILPLRCVTNQLSSPIMDLNDRLLLPRDVRSLCILLTRMDDITTLDLSRNSLCNEGATSVAKMLRRNDSVTHLKLKYCKLSSSGISNILESIVNNRAIQSLDLTGNTLLLNHMKQLDWILKKNKNIRELVLSYCSIDENGARILGSAIAETSYLKSLDLSWNGIRKRGAKAFMDGLSENTTLEYVNLSWNGLAREGSKALENCLKENRILKELDLTCNRIDFIALKPLVNGLVKNETLKKIMLASNPITTKGAISTLCAIKKSPDCALSEIDLREIPVNSQFMKCLAELYDTRPIKILHGDHLHNSESENPESALNSYDPCMVLFEFMRQQKLRLVDLFNAIDADRSGTITRQELCQVFQAINLPLSDGALQLLMERLDADESNEIDINELKLGQKNVLKKAHALKANDEEYAEIIADIQQLVKNSIERKRKRKPYQQKDIISQIERAMK